MLGSWSRRNEARCTIQEALSPQMQKPSEVHGDGLSAAVWTSQGGALANMGSSKSPMLWEQVRSGEIYRIATR